MKPIQCSELTARFQSFGWQAEDVARQIAGVAIVPKSRRGSCHGRRGRCRGQVAVASWDESMDVGLYPEEEHAIVAAVPTRRLEFARGRACARAALNELGLPPAPIPVGSNREPIWPTDFVGSITHQADVVFAVAARLEDISAIGVDVEKGEPLANDTAALIGSMDEWSELRRLGLPDTVLFSAKEAVFKAVFPMVRHWIDFLDVRVSFDQEADGFFTEPLSLALPKTLTDSLQGRFAVIDDRVLTMAFIRADSSPNCAHSSRVL